MNTQPLKELGKSVLRILAALAILFGTLTLAYLVWQPGSDTPLPELRNHAIWLGHGWLGDDRWFAQNRRDKAAFRDPEKISALFRKLSEHKIATVYPHLCPTRYDGRIAPYDDLQIERFLDLAESGGIKVIPWIGGVRNESARPADADWRRNFVASVDELLKKHPRLAGVQVNIEPMPGGNDDFLRLLEELRAVTQNKILSVAAYPPPTRWHRFPDVHWNLGYINCIARRCNQLAVMMYDTAIPLEKFYIQLIRDWTQELTDTVPPCCELLLGIPAYEDADVDYHHPRVENLSSALRGISAADRHSIAGLAIYCEWEMNDTKWRLWRKFVK